MAGTIQYIKISKIDQNGTDLTPQLESINTLTLPSGSSFAEYTIRNKTRYNDYFLYYVTPPNRVDIPDANKSNIVFNYEAPVKDQVTGMYNLVAGPLPVSLESNTPTISSEAFFIEQGTGIFENKFHSQIQTYPTESIHVSLNFTASRNLTNSETIAVALCKNSTFPTSTSTVLNTAGGLPATSSGHNTSGVTGTLTAETLLFPGEYIFAGLFKKSSSSNGLTAQLTGSLIISSSAQSGPTLQTIIEPYFTTDFYKSECDVLQNNATQGIPNTLLQKVDYSTNAMNPVNFEALISGTATNADIPQSYFEVSSILNPSYNLSIIQSSDVNIYNPLGFRGQTTTDFGDPINIGTYGQTPSVSSLSTIIYEFEWGGGTSPFILDSGAVKMGRILEVSSEDQVKTILPSDGLDSISISTNLLASSASLYGINLATTQSRGDYYQILNANNPVNSRINMFMYPNTTAGSTPTLPSTTKILTTEFGVPTKPTFMATSSNAADYGTWFGTNNYITLDRSVPLSRANSDYTVGSTILPQTGSGAVKGFIDIILDSINEENARWFITIYEDLEVGFVNTDLDPFNDGMLNKDSNGDFLEPLGSKGVFEILGIDYMTSSTQTRLFINKKTGSTKILGQGAAGFFIWKARAAGKNEFVIVRDEVSGGVQAGAFTSAFVPAYLQDNFEAITKEFGTNQTG